MKKWMIWVIAILILLVILVVVFKGFGEDSWIKNEKGIYINHGNPLKTPAYVKEQQDAVICAIDLYENALVSLKAIFAPTHILEPLISTPKKFFSGNRCLLFL